MRERCVAFDRLPSKLSQVLFHFIGRRGLHCIKLHTVWPVGLFRGVYGRISWLCH